ncbi:MAG: Sec-independent protein translocase protein TatB [Rudaea sp.]
MFDFSFGEIGLIAVVALVVLGPERLPKVARTAGALVRRARTSWQSVKDEIERELEAEDLKRSFSEARQAASDLRDEMHRTSSDIESSAREATNLGPSADGSPALADTGAPAQPADALAAPATESESGVDAGGRAADRIETVAKPQEPAR